MFMWKNSVGKKYITLLLIYDIPIQSICGMVYSHSVTHSSVPYHWRGIKVPFSLLALEGTGTRVRRTIVD